MRSRLLQLACALALVAVCCYIALSAAPLFLEGRRTEPAKQLSVRDTYAVRGVFLRAEYVLPHIPGLFPALGEGERVENGGDLGGGEPAPVGGIFTAKLDGYEHLSPPAKLAPREVLALTGDKRVASGSAGKLITDSVWRYFAVLETKKAEALRVGERYTLETPYWGGVSLRLSALGDTWQDFTAAVFEGSGDMDKILYLRETSAVLVLSEHTGLSIPRQALYEDTQGYYTQVLTLGMPQRAQVQPIYYGEGFVLVVSPELWDGSEILIDNLDREAQK